MSGSRIGARRRVLIAGYPRASLVAIALAAALTLTLAGSADTASIIAPACTPARLDTSAALAGGAVTVSPAPETMDASHRTQISFLGVPATSLLDVEAVGSRSGPHPGRLAAYSQGDGASFVPSTPFSEGETVTVHAALRSAVNTTRFSWRFTTAEVSAVSRSLETPPPPPPPPKRSELQHFVWRLLAGSSSRALVPVASEPRSGFETTIALAHASRYLAVQALNVGGGVLGTSRTVRP